MCIEFESCTKIRMHPAQPRYARPGGMHNKGNTFLLFLFLLFSIFLWEINLPDNFGLEFVFFFAESLNFLVPSEEVKMQKYCLFFNCFELLYLMAFFKTFLLCGFYILFLQKKKKKIILNTKNTIISQNCKQEVFLPEWARSWPV